MNMPDDYIKNLGYDSVQQWIEDLYLSSMIDAYKIVKNIPNISSLTENPIRNRFQYALMYECGKISDFINDNTISFGAEVQIITKEDEIKRWDIQFFIPKLLYIIECKRIDGAEQAQYVEAGIKRFVYAEYIKDIEDYAGMCSFVVGGNLEGIISRLREKVGNYHFSIEKAYLLNQKVCDWEASFQSQHKKQNSEKDIHIHHLFFDFR